MKKLIYISLMILSLSFSVQAQTPVLIHSHNDYAQLSPFWLAYSQKAHSVECDMFYVGRGKFLIGHGRDDFRYNQIFDVWYLEPIVRMYRYNGGLAWPEDKENFLQLYIDIKSEDPDAFVKALVKKLKKYPDVFDSSVNPLACRVVTGGNPKDFDKYPAIINFDGNLDKEYTPAQLERVALFSEYFGNYSHWDGKGPLPAEDELKIKEAVAKAHSLGKPIRFWEAPDNAAAWQKLIELGVDYLNTDKLAECGIFLKAWNAREDR